MSPHDGASRIQRCADVQYDEPDQPGTILRDMLADLRHYADRHGEEFHSADRMAYQHYLAERGTT